MVPHPAYLLSANGEWIEAVNQLLCGVPIAVAAEALAFAEAMQLDAAATWEVLRTGPAPSLMLDDRGERMVHGTDPVKSALDIFGRTWALCLTPPGRMSPGRQQAAPLASAAEQLYRAGHRAGLGHAMTRPSSRYSAVGGP
jgi:3-hydroxyisobutyrate dehydrogenase